MSWSTDKSVILSQISTRIIMVLGVGLAIALPFLCVSGFFDNRAFIATQHVMLILPVYYTFCVPVYVALFALDRLLAAIKRNRVFTTQNVRYLRIISWASFATALVLLVSTLVSFTFFALAIVAAFVGIVLRAVKNLFAAAVELQEESNFTI